MRDPRIIVQRRFPWYDFVLITSAEPPNAAVLLAGSGDVSGRKFRLRRARVCYRVEGSLIPSVAGSNVHVRVRAPWLVWAVDAILFAIGALTESDVAMPAGVAVLMASYLVLHFQVDGAKRLLEAVLPPG
jgi:hypothetical protein